MLASLAVASLSFGTAVAGSDLPGLLIGDGAPLLHWLQQSHQSGGEPRTSGHVLLTGNATAHIEALKAEILARSPGSDALHLLDPAAWYQFNCADGCESLMDNVSHALRERTGLWTVVLVNQAEHASPSQIASLVGRFWRSAQCTHATASWQLAIDCRRTLFALSTAIGSDILEGETPGHMSCASEYSEDPEGTASEADGMACADSNGRADSVGAAPAVSGLGGATVSGGVSSGSSSFSLRKHMLAEGSAWLAAVAAAAPASQRPARAMRTAIAVVLGSPGASFFSSLIARQNAQRGRRMADGREGVDTAEPDTSALARLVGQEAVVNEVRGRLAAIAAGADSGEDAHVFFFYGFPGTGKTYLAELIAQAVHGSTALPHYKKFAMQNYKTDEEMWTFVSPPCGVKGKEGAYEQLFSAPQPQAESKAHSPRRPGPVLVFDEIEEAHKDFMTSALINAIDHRGYVEYRVKPESDQCMVIQSPTGGSFFVLTSNCFMDDLAEVLARESIPGRSSAEVYFATRAEMDRRIFDERIPCSRSGTIASPFAAGKMRDRMRGNVWPFLPLSAEQQMATFELELEQRAVLYAKSNNVSLHWTVEFARLAMRPSDAASDLPTPRAAANAATPVSVRKQIDMLMRLNPTSVEHLYAAGVARCRPRRMHTLILHVRADKPAGKAVCDDADATASRSYSPNVALPPVYLAPPPSTPHAPPSPAWTTSPAFGSSAVMPRAMAIYADLDVASDARQIASQFDAEIQLRLQLDAAQKRSTELENQVEHLQSMLYLTLICAVLMVILISLAVLSMSHIFIAYSFMVIKTAAVITTVGVVVALTALRLCYNGSVIACRLVEAMWAAVRLVSAMVYRFGCYLFWQLVAAMGPWGPVAAFAFAVVLMPTVRVLLRRMISSTRQEVDLARHDLETARRERDAARRTGEDAARRLEDAERVLRLFQVEIHRALVDAQTTRAEIRQLEGEWCVVGPGGDTSPVGEIRSLEGRNRSDEDDSDLHIG